MMGEVLKFSRPPRTSNFLPCHFIVVRLQKFLAEAGVASRRASEQFIVDGRVAVNGHPVRLLGSKVDPAQ
jgi:ribosomal protein S4